MELSKLYKKRLNELAGINENIISPPDIPGAMHFWHGGNLDNFNDIIAQKNGQYEYGPGLYIITHYSTAAKYAKGSRKLYLVSVMPGVDINEAMISLDEVLKFVNTYVIGRLKKEFLERLKTFIVDNKVKAYGFNNIIINTKAVKSINTHAWRQFYIDNGIDYNIIDNAFGWGNTKMMVLYNMKKIVNIIRVKPGDKISMFDL